jgi:DNA-binding CsgD family transcriptional regulator
MNARQYVFFFLKYGLVAGMAIVAFAVLKSNWFFTGQYPDLYLTLIGIGFLLAGFLVRAKFQSIPGYQPIKTLEIVPQNDLELLSRREMAVLKLVYAGQTNKEIAAALFIELSTVKAHINTIYKKLGVKNRKEVWVKYRDDEIIID